MSRNAKQVTVAVTAVNVVFFFLLFYTLLKYRDTPAFVNSLLYTTLDPESLMDHMTTWSGLKTPYELVRPLQVVDKITMVFNVYGCFCLVQENDRQAIPPLDKRALQILFLAIGLAAIFYVILLRGFFADTYPRLWMILADGVFLPILFFVLLLCGLHRRRQMELCG